MAKRKVPRQVAQVLRDLGLQRVVKSKGQSKVVGHFPKTAPGLLTKFITEATGKLMSESIAYGRSGMTNYDTAKELASLRSGIRLFAAALKYVAVDNRRSYRAPSKNPGVAFKYLLRLTQDGSAVVDRLILLAGFDTGRLANLRGGLTNRNGLTTLLSSACRSAEFPIKGRTITRPEFVDLMLGISQAAGVENPSQPKFAEIQKMIRVMATYDPNEEYVDRENKQFVPTAAGNAARAETAYMSSVVTGKRQTKKAEHDRQVQERKDTRKTKSTNDKLAKLATRRAKANERLTKIVSAISELGGGVAA